MGRGLRGYLKAKKFFDFYAADYYKAGLSRPPRFNPSRPHTRQKNKGNAHRESFKPLQRMTF
jgi:hypothetical protein